MSAYNTSCFACKLLKMQQKRLGLWDLIGHSSVVFHPELRVMRRCGGFYYIPIRLCVYLPDFANKAPTPADHHSPHRSWRVVCLQSLMICSTAECIFVFLRLSASNITGSLVLCARDRLGDVPSKAILQFWGQKGFRSLSTPPPSPMTDWTTICGCLALSMPPSARLMSLSSVCRSSLRCLTGNYLVSQAKENRSFPSPNSSERDEDWSQKVSFGGRISANFHLQQTLLSAICGSCNFHSVPL